LSTFWNKSAQAKQAAKAISATNAAQDSQRHLNIAMQINSLAKNTALGMSLALNHAEFFQTREPFSCTR